MKREVKYKGVVVGYTSYGQTIELLDNDQAKEIKKIMTENSKVGISARFSIEINDNKYITDRVISDTSIDLQDLEILL